MTRSTAVAVATGGLGVTVAVVADLGLEVGQKRRGLMSSRRRAAAVGARTGAGAVGPRATASVVVVSARGARSGARPCSRTRTTSAPAVPPDLSFLP